jgi:predicted dehydrogenase
MSQNRSNRRDFLKTSTAAAAGATLPYWFTSATRSRAEDSPNERPVLGCIGVGDRWSGGPGPAAMQFADCVAVCDVDALHLDAARDRVKNIQGRRGSDRPVAMYGDYRELLDRNDLEVITVVTPDHWHTRCAIAAMRSGRDVYCEKPLTLTIHEGKQIIKVLEETNRVFQVGTQQRSEMDLRFLRAIAMIRDGRIGKVRKVTCDIGGAPVSPSIPKVDVPQGLDWDMWLGQAPKVDYIYLDTGSRYGNSRCHYEFRWWYEYSGGKMTDWGAHHVDIAQWAIGQNGPDQGCLSVEGTAEHPVPFENGHPTQDDKYNTASKFHITVMFPDDVEMHIVSESPDGNGILFEGTAGRFHVSRGNMRGAPVEELQTRPLPDGAIQAVYGGKEPGNHMRNFMECVKSRETPISDVWSHHRALTTCHLSNIAIRLGRRLEWDPVAQQIVGDDDANAWQSREQRKGYEIDVSV